MSALTRLYDRAQQVLALDSVHVPSPCVSICVINPNSGLCEGCLRTLDGAVGSRNRHPSLGTSSARCCRGRAFEPCWTRPLFFGSVAAWGAGWVAVCCC